MTAPLSDQQKKNLTNILGMAKIKMAAAKKKAVEEGDFDTSLRIASNEARIEGYFRERGVEVIDTSSK